MSANTLGSPPHQFNSADTSVESGTMFHLDLGGLQDSTPHSTSSSKGLRRLSVLTRNQKKQLLNSAEKSVTPEGQINDEFTPLSKPLATLHETPVSSGTRKRKSLMSFPSNTSNNESSSTKKKNKRRASVSPLGGPIVQTRNQRRTSQLVPMMETIGEVASLPTTSSSAAKKQFASARDIQLRARWLFGEQGAFDKDEPCLSAHILACFSLWNDMNDETNDSNLSTNQSAILKTDFDGILDYLQELVASEAKQIDGPAALMEDDDLSRAYENATITKLLDFLSSHTNGDFTNQWVVKCAEAVSPSCQIDAVEEVARRLRKQIEDQTRDCTSPKAKESLLVDPFLVSPKDSAMVVSSQESVDNHYFDQDTQADFDSTTNDEQPSKSDHASESLTIHSDNLKLIQPNDSKPLNIKPPLLSALENKDDCSTHSSASLAENKSDGDHTPMEEVDVENDSHVESKEIVPVVSSDGDNITDVTPEMGRNQKSSATPVSILRKTSCVKASSQKILGMDENQLPIGVSLFVNENDTCDWTVEMLHAEIKTLFGEIDVVGTSCLSARIFACYSLWVSSKKPTEEASDKLAKPSLEPILDYLRSIVLAEVISSQVSSNAIKEEAQPVRRSTRVQFCSFDFSSTAPPVDRIQGSDFHQEESIRALSKAKWALSELETLSFRDPRRDSVRACLVALLDFLKRPDDSGWQVLCARSVSTDYHRNRVVKAAKLQRVEMQRLFARMEGRTSTPLLMEEKFASLCGQAMRYQIRVLFRPPPPRLTPKDSLYDKWKMRHSTVHELVVTPEGDAFDYDRLSTLFSTALDVMVEYFGLDTMLPSGEHKFFLPTSFAESEASQRSIPRSGGIALTEEETKQVCKDILLASSTITCFKAAKFLHSLLSVEAVQKEIKRQGGWAAIETYATYSYDHELWKIHPEDRHFPCLCNYDSLFRKVELIADALEKPSTYAQESLDSLAKRHRLSSKSKKLLAMHPEITVLSTCMGESLALSMDFPSLQEAS